MVEYAYVQDGSVISVGSLPICLEYIKELTLLKMMTMFIVLVILTVLLLILS